MLCGRRYPWGLRMEATWIRAGPCFGCGDWIHWLPSPDRLLKLLHLQVWLVRRGHCVNGMSGVVHVLY